MAAGISISTAIMATSFGLRVNHFAIFSSMADQSFPPNRPVMAAQKSLNICATRPQKVVCTSAAASASVSSSSGMVIS